MPFIHRRGETFDRVAAFDEQAAARGATEVGLDHAGVGDDGQPWLALEYVEGERIDVHVDPGTARVTGDLTMRGVTKPLTLDVRFNKAGPNPMNKVYTVGFDATGTIKRSLWGVNYGVPAVGDDVRAAAIRAAA